MNCLKGRERVSGCTVQDHALWTLPMVGVGSSRQPHSESLDQAICGASTGRYPPTIFLFITTYLPTSTCKLHLFLCISFPPSLCAALRPPRGGIDTLSNLPSPRSFLAKLDYTYSCFFFACARHPATLYRMFSAAQLVSLVDMMVRQSWPLNHTTLHSWDNTDFFYPKTSSTSTATPLKHEFTRQVEEVKTPKR